MADNDNDDAPEFSEVSAGPGEPIPDDTDTKLFHAYIRVSTGEPRKETPMDLGRKWLDRGKSVEDVVGMFRRYCTMRHGGPG